MARIDWNRWQTILICLALVVVLLFALVIALAQIAHTLVLFMLAAVVALVLVPLVDWGESHGLRRWLAVVVTYLGCGLLLLGGGLLLLSPLTSQVAELASKLPDYLASLQGWLQQVGESLASSPIAWAIQAIQAQVLSTLADWSAELTTWLVGVLAGVGSSVVDAFLIVIISIYMLAGGRRIHRSVHRVLPRRYGGHFLFVTEALTRIIGGYIRAQLVLALLLGGAVSIGLGLLGMPYALVLGLMAMVLGLIPMFGSALSAVPALLVALTQPFPMVVWVGIFFIIVQNVQDQVLAPRIQGRNVGLHPLAVMFALLAGAQVGGLVGAIFALPAAALAWILLVAAYRSLGLQPADEEESREEQREERAVQVVTAQEQPVPRA